ncbi:hypothetical protein RRG08_004963 [Elysia crispata]|uniref:Uncharacterized protein n=1 Tax=Elysia crispata TaxID=231223 RepID=A0AAE0ZHX0_9GAST|nr:hypothetical protein RRG08_004963 [Elysia crispata]
MDPIYRRVSWFAGTRSSWPLMLGFTLLTKEKTRAPPAPASASRARVEPREGGPPHPRRPRGSTEAGCIAPINYFCTRLFLHLDTHACTGVYVCPERRVFI